MLQHIRRLAAVVVFATAVYAQVQPTLADPGDYPYGCYINSFPYCAWGNYLQNATFDGCLENPEVWSGCDSADLFCDQWCSSVAQAWGDDWGGGYAIACAINSGVGPGHSGQCECYYSPYYCDSYCYAYQYEPPFC